MQNYVLKVEKNSMEKIFIESKKKKFLKSNIMYFYLQIKKFFS